jgi:hypothetical protein
MSEEKRYYIADPQAVREVLEHRINYAKISVKKPNSDEWSSVGYISWSKAGKTLTIMVSEKHV